MQRSKVMLISSVHRWDDSRIMFREALSLAKRYEVEVHAIAPFKEEMHFGIKVVGLTERSPFTRPLHWFVLGYRVLKSDAEVVQFHDPDLVILAIFLRLFGRKVIYDVHELVAEDILTKRWIPKLLRPIARWLYRFLARLSMPALSAVISVSEPISNEYRHRKKATVRNYPPLELFNGNVKNRRRYRSGDTLRLIYSGSIHPARGVVEILEACALLPPQLPYHLDLIGKIPVATDYGDRLFKALIPVQNNVTLHGWLQFPVVIEKMVEAHIGLVCTQPNSSDPLGSPLKLYEYMAAGLAMVVADFEEWSPTVAAYPFATQIDCTDPALIAQTITLLADKLGDSESMAASSGERRYDWGGEEKKLLELYDSIVTPEA